MFGAERVSMPAGPFSGKRLGNLRQEIAKSFEKTGLDADGALIAKEVLPAFEKSVDWQKGVELWTPDRCDAYAQKKLDEAAAREYPSLTELEEKQLAEEAYPLYKEGDTVSVTYMPNPNYPTTVRGVYRGCIGGTVRVGRSQIRLSDMEDIEGNDVEILKFKADETRLLRQEFIRGKRAEIQAKRDVFLKEHKDEYFDAAYDKGGDENEKHGYVCLNDEWLTPADCVAAVVEETRRELRMGQEMARLREDSLQTEAVFRVASSVVQQRKALPIVQRLDPMEVLRAQALAEEQRIAAANKLAREQEEAREKAALAKKEADARRAQMREAERLRLMNEEVDTSELDNVFGMSATTMIIYIVSVVALLGLVGLLFFMYHKKQEKERFTKFFQAKGEVQKRFWDAVNANPDEFKYVTYLYPNDSEATAALTQLSYITLNEKGELVNNKNLDYCGIYPHREGTVAFVGGTNLHYAAWREASAVLPEIPNAVYFKVSTEPQVLLQVPTAADNLGFDVENLGTEDIVLDNGSYAKVFHFHIDTKEHALHYLDLFQIGEEGIIAQVKLDDGTVVGKDINGVYEA